MWYWKFHKFTESMFEYPMCYKSLQKDHEQIMILNVVINKFYQAIKCGVVCNVSNTSLCYCIKGACLPEHMQI